MSGTGSTGSGLEGHPVVSRDEWLEARRALLAREKEFTRQRDQLGEERRRLPWVRVDKPYRFDGPAGEVGLADLFEGRSQLAVYHFMFAPEWEAGCPHCSFWADHFDGMAAHLRQRDATLVAVSRAPRAKLTAYQRRMGWKFPWLSSGGGDFNFDFAVSFVPEALAGKQPVYNYGTLAPGVSDREGASAFYRDPAGAVFHTYSSYARGIDLLNGTYNFLDLLPKGRDEGDRGQYWVRRHDEYGK
jgi:predicted dithiol-disulfide oxidoreductase (DUF899 family)